ncbi:MAG TPA: Uma2 family endonuclease, partial [Chloroflexota bacterium]|nr:Uma2 family endonuclease [Chloroflexota bacterium]
PALEYEDGVVTQKVSPKRRHGALQVEFAELVNAFARPRRLARAFTETRVVLRGRSYVPDVVVYRWDRVPLDPSGEIQDGNFETPPDVAVEVLSPGQSMTKAVDRCSWYVRNGAPASVLIVPEDRAILLFRPGAPPQVVQGTERLELDEVLSGFQLTADQLFGALRMS